MPAMPNTTAECPSTRDRRADGTGRVFVVDDDGAVASALARLLRSEGYAVRTFPSGPSFLDEFSVCPGGCLLLDINMPHMSGRTLQRLVRERGWRLPVIYITGHPFPGGEEAALADGARALLSKPVEPGPLLTEVSAALEGNR